MVAEIWDRFEAIEECYEFMLAYAAQGLTTDEGNESGRQVRKFLSRAAEVLDGLAASCSTAGLSFGTSGMARRTGSPQ